MIIMIIIIIIVIIVVVIIIIIILFMLLIVFRFVSTRIRGYNAGHTQLSTSLYVLLFFLFN